MLRSNKLFYFSEDSDEISDSLPIDLKINLNIYSYLKFTVVFLYNFLEKFLFCSFRYKPLRCKELLNFS